MSNTDRSPIKRPPLRKLTYVGAYAGSMLVSKFPAVLPKFCAAIGVVLDASGQIRRWSCES